MSETRANPVYCALDTTEVDRARRIASEIAGAVGGIKLGKEFFAANGPKAVREVVEASGLPLFLDLKFHDIPNTVAGALRAACRSMRPAIVNVHATGGRAMLEAAREAVAGAGGDTPPKLIAVTVLTSLDDADLAEVGLLGPAGERAVELARLTQDSGLDGVVCSPREIAAIRAACGPDFQLVVPGVRPAGTAAGDQKRVTTPLEARDAGADVLVIGRPITGAEDPGAAARAIAAELGCAT